MLDTVVIGALLVIVGLLLSSLHRISRNAGPLSLEDHARHNGVVYAPISLTIAKELETWSKPLRMRAEVKPGSPICELIFTTKLTDEEEA